MEPRTAAQFAPGVIDASRAVLVELGVILRSYLNDLALIGGWAPYFLLQQHQQAGFDHVGSIDIDLAVQSGVPVLTIADSGAGIPEQERHSIFYRFYRVPGTRQSGSGLGLAIAKTIADRHQTSIELADASLGGLAVTLKFPPLPGGFACFTFRGGLVLVMHS